MLDSGKRRSGEVSDNALQPIIFPSTTDGLSVGNLHRGFSHSSHVRFVSGRKSKSWLSEVRGKMWLHACSYSWSKHPHIMVRDALICWMKDGDRVIIFPWRLIVHCL